MIKSNQRLIIALDGSEKDIRDVINHTHDLRPTYKFGIPYLLGGSKEQLRRLQYQHHTIFFDLKIYDTPDTIKRILQSDLFTEPTFKNLLKLVTVHSDCIEAAQEYATCNTQIVSISSLTSKEVSDQLLTATSKYHNDRLKEANIRYMVCSPGHIHFHEQHQDDDFSFICPGIRLDDSKDNHHEVYTPAQAIQQGADYIVVGRPIMESSNPRATVKQILEQIDESTN